MPSQGVIDRQRVGEAILAAARIHAHPVGERMQPNLAAVVQDGEVLSGELPTDETDWIHLQRELVRHLEASLDALVTTDAEHLAGLAAVSEARDRRDRATSELYRSIRDLRAGTALFFGHDRTARLLGVRGSTARWPNALLRQARSVVEHLRHPQPELSGPELVPGLEFEPAPVADRLQTQMDRLDEALAEVAYETEQSRRTGALREDAFEAFDRAVRGVGRVLKGCYTLAGSPELARELRFDVKAKGGV